MDAADGCIKLRRVSDILEALSGKEPKALLDPIALWMLLMLEFKAKCRARCPVWLLSVRSGIIA